MTITRISPGVWELRTRHGTLIATADLYTIVTLWTRIRRDGWCEIPYGQKQTLDGRPSIEFTGCHDCRCRACTSPASCT
jgi:hypothetical protein